MKILTVSDRVEPILYKRFEPDQFKNIDLILACGDLPPEYLSFLHDRLNAPLFFVRGNHDIRHLSKPPDGCIDLNTRMIKYEGIKFLGLEGSRWYNGGPFQYREMEMRRKILRLKPQLWWKGGVDIIITHAPPRHVHDGPDRCHRGFKSFNWLIQKYSPNYLIHGHIHANFSDPSQRMTVINKTTVVNTYGYFIIDTENERSAA
jgi:Icc-related predicted phosphoesterase